MASRPVRVGVIAAVLLACPVLAFAQFKETSTEALVLCTGVNAPPALTPVEFAKSHLVSLSWAKRAASTTEIEKAGKDSATWMSFVTALMRATKMSTNDFICAKRAVLPFTSGPKDDNSTVAAQFLTLVYLQHIDINQRAIEVLKKMDTLSQGELSDQLSTLQVERGQRWGDLVQPTAMALMGLVDQKRVENDTMPYLIVTKAEKKALLGVATAEFPEFSDGTAKDKWSNPAKSANLYLTLLTGRKCADEK